MNILNGLNMTYRFIRIFIYINENKRPLMKEKIYYIYSIAQ